MALPSRSLRALVCASDLVERRAMVAAATGLGFEVLEEVDNAARAIQLAPLLHPTLVLIANELYGLRGVEAVTPLREHVSEADLPPEILLVSADQGVRAEAYAAGALVVVPRDDAEALADGLDDMRHLLETGERRGGADRRAGEDRRQAQDWSKVTRERRSGDDRRKGPRRTDEAGAPR
jgi:CheY-like chemotaxis protein